MKIAIFGIMLLAALAPVAFAQTWCEESCCDESGGSWDSDYEMCDSPGGSYYTCLDDYCSSSASSSGSSGNVSCCGSGFILGAVGATAFLCMNQKVAR